VDLFQEKSMGTDISGKGAAGWAGICEREGLFVDDPITYFRDR
jgi:hypothetical protein